MEFRTQCEKESARGPLERIALAPYTSKISSFLQANSNLSSKETKRMSITLKLWENIVGRGPETPTANPLQPEDGRKCGRWRTLTQLERNSNSFVSKVRIQKPDNCALLLALEQFLPSNPEGDRGTAKIDICSGILHCVISHILLGGLWTEKMPLPSNEF